MKSRNLLVIALCVLITVFGIVMTIFSFQNNTVGVASLISSEAAMRTTTAEEIGGEEYDTAYGYETRIYFTNRDLLDKDFFPFEVNDRLVPEIERALAGTPYAEATEFRIQEEGIENTDKVASFHCSLPECGDHIITITYDRVSTLITVSY